MFFFLCFVLLFSYCSIIQLICGSCDYWLEEFCMFILSGMFRMSGMFGIPDDDTWRLPVCSSPLAGEAGAALSLFVNSFVNLFALLELHASETSLPFVCLVSTLGHRLLCVLRSPCLLFFAYFPKLVVCFGIPNHPKNIQKTSHTHSKIIQKQFPTFPIIIP